MTEFIYRHRLLWIFSAMLILAINLQIILDFTAVFICRHWMLFCLLAVTFALILSFQKKQTLVQLGKSTSCGAFLLFNWAIFYVDAYRRYLPNISDVWRWFPAVIFSGIFIICVLTIWKPFDGKYLRKYVLILAGFMVALTVGTVMIWEDDALFTTVLDHSPIGESIFEEFWRILNHPSWYPYSTWYLRIISTIVALASFLSYRKNQTVARIGKSILSATLVFIPWAEFSWQLVYEWQRWTVSIVCIGIFLAVLFFIWKPSIAKRQVNS